MGILLLCAASFLSTVCNARIVQLTQKPVVFASCGPAPPGRGELLLYCPDASPSTAPCFPTERPDSCVATFTFATRHISSNVETTFSLQQGGTNLSTVTHRFQDVFDEQFGKAFNAGYAPLKVVPPFYHLLP